MKETTLRELRESVGMTQQELADKTRVTQPEISRAERGINHQLFTLRGIVEALGGKLELIVSFPNDEVVKLKL